MPKFVVRLNALISNPAREVEVEAASPEDAIARAERRSHAPFLVRLLLAALDWLGWPHARPHSFRAGEVSELEVDDAFPDDPEILNAWEVVTWCEGCGVPILEGPDRPGDYVSGEDGNACRPCYEDWVKTAECHFCGCAEGANERGEYGEPFCSEACAASALETSDWNAFENACPHPPHPKREEAPRG